MVIAAILSLARTQFLDDTRSPYLWSDDYLVQCGSQVERDATERGYLLASFPNISSATAADVSNGTATGTTANKLVNSAAAFTSASLNKTVYNTTDGTFATVTVVDSPTQLSLSANIMATGETYVIGDALKALTRVCVVSGQSEYSLSSKVLKVKKCYLNSNKIPLKQVTEGWLDAHWYQWRSAVGLPQYYIEDKGSLTLIPQPDSSLNSETGKDTLLLSVYRYPLNDLSLTSGTLEIPEEYHFGLVHGICALAYQKQDSETYNPSKGNWHEGEFTRCFGPKLSSRGKEALRDMPSDFEITQPQMIC